jgi:preprotein translocase subunit SecG
MYTLVLVIHLIVCLFLIFIVLIQSGKGAELGAAFGGSSQTIFGARGAATFFSKLTTVAAVVYMLTSLTLAVITTRGSSVIKQTVPQTTEQQETIPQGTGPLQGVQPTQSEEENTPAVPDKPSE